MYVKCVTLAVLAEKGFCAYLAVERPIERIICTMKAHVEKQTSFRTEHLVRITMDLLVHLQSR